MTLLSIVAKSQRELEFAGELVKRQLIVNKPLVITVTDYIKRRSGSQNRMQWAGMLGDFADQGEINGRKFSADVWHHYLKERFLPNEYQEGITLEDYTKWTELPNGKLILTGSTTKLTTKGHSEYMDKCYAFGGSELGIRFTVVERG